MGGTVLTVAVKPGDTVKRGDELFVFEAMKMENSIIAERNGVIKRVFIEPGQVIATNAVLIEYEK